MVLGPLMVHQVGALGRGHHLQGAALHVLLVPGAEEGHRVLVEAHVHAVELHHDVQHRRVDVPPLGVGERHRAVLGVVQVGQRPLLLFALAHALLAHAPADGLPEAGAVQELVVGADLVLLHDRGLDALHLFGGGVAEGRHHGLLLLHHRLESGHGGVLLVHRLVHAVLRHAHVGLGLLELRLYAGPLLLHRLHLLLPVPNLGRGAAAAHAVLARGPREGLLLVVVVEGVDVAGSAGRGVGGAIHLVPERGHHERVGLLEEVGDPHKGELLDQLLRLVHEEVLHLGVLAAPADLRGLLMHRVVGEAQHLEGVPVVDYLVHPTSQGRASVSSGWRGTSAGEAGVPPSHVIPGMPVYVMGET
mmetsp:Transcript_66290/g.209570  ORF Transcript_66290/g.209570 Transcript_66290/m.209570 type:complete len:360 (+) Transcript_66290:388-1467(+)